MLKISSTHRECPRRKVKKLSGAPIIAEESLVINSFPQQRGQNPGEAATRIVRLRSLQSATEPRNVCLDILA